MKALFSIVLFTAFLAQLGVRPIVVLNWKINQDRITEKYCENKNRPEMECDGKCYLAKQLRKLDVEEQNERSKNQLPEQQLKSAEIPFIAPKYPIESIVFAVFPAVKKHAFVEPHGMYRFTFITENFHPPASRF
jgi:hypothetical protein